MTNGSPLRFAALALAAGLTAAQADDATAPPAAPAPAAAPQAVPPVAGAPVPRHVYLIGTLRITQPYLDLTHGLDGAVPGHITIENRSEAPDKLVGVTAEGGASVALLTRRDELTPAIALPPDLTLELRDGADHLAFSGLDPLPAGGAPVSAVLHFERAGSLRVAFATEHTDIAQAPPAPAAPDKPVDLAQ